MIQAVYILIADSGLCVLDRKYGEADMDPNLISGFLTALIQFGRELSDGNAAMAVLSEVNNAFTDDYGSMLAEWDGNLEPFETFYSKLDEITKTGRASETKIVVPLLKGKVSPMLVRLGQMSQETFDVAEKCKGKLTARDIADQLGHHLKEVQKSLNTLEDMKILEWKEIG